MAGMKILSMPLVVSVYIVTILANWCYAYEVQYLPGIIISSWSVVFPFISLFYFVFSATACAGLYRKTPWGLRLASFMIMLGAIAGALSFGLAYKQYPDVEELYVLLVIIDCFVLIYLEIYYYLR